MVKTMGIVLVASSLPDWQGVSGDNDRHLTTHKISSHFGQQGVLPLRPAIFDSHVLAFNVADFLKPL